MSSIPSGSYVLFPSSSALLSEVWGKRFDGDIPSRAEHSKVLLAPCVCVYAWLCVRKLYIFFQVLQLHSEWCHIYFFDWTNYGALLKDSKHLGKIDGWVFFRTYLWTYWLNIIQQMCNNRSKLTLFLKKHYGRNWIIFGFTIDFRSP